MILTILNSAQSLSSDFVSDFMLDDFGSSFTIIPRLENCGSLGHMRGKVKIVSPQPHCMNNSRVDKKQTYCIQLAFISEGDEDPT